MSTTERRQASRIVFESSAVIRYEQDRILETPVDTRNISLNGLYLETDSRIPVGTPCKISIQLTGVTSKMDFKVQGLVCRHDQGGMGINFTHLDEDSYLHIINLVNLHAAAELK